MMPGPLPPSSSVTGFSVGAALDMIFLPVAIEPVNTILSTCSCRDSAAPSSSPPETTLSRPGGSSFAASSNARRVVSGVNGDGLITTVLPVRIAGTTCQMAISRGKFHGVMEPTTPSGSRCISMTLVSLCSRIFTGRLRPAV